LWNARGFARAERINLSPLLVEFAEAEAVARCEGTRPVFMTGARYGSISGLLPVDRTIPNQRTNLVVASTAIVTFWETNWDPLTNTTNDGSDTVWVNALHIITPTEDIVLGHAEATIDCTPDGQPTSQPTGITTPPPGGFPRQVTLEPSKRKVLYSKVFSLAGSVTPATEFETPRRCIDNVPVVIRRDDVGAPQEFRDVATVFTDSNGNFSFNYRADSNAQWLAFVDKNVPTDCAQEASQARPVLVKPRINLQVNDKTPRRGSLIRFRATLRPCGDHAGGKIFLRQQFGSRMVTIDRSRTDNFCRAVFVVRANFKRAVFDASWPKQDADHQTGRAVPKVIRTHR
jgi:hypothetical protein